MRKFGLIGGMSWVSTGTYYEHINRIVQRRVDPRASAPLLIESLDFSQIYRLSSEEEWARAATILSDSARRLEQAGAGAIAIAANSMHRVYDEVQSAVDVPILHIADCVGARMADDGVDSAVVLGTRNVMTESFYRNRLVMRGIDLLPPETGDVDELNRIIYEELMIGRVTRDSERELRTMITLRERAGAGAVILACTELEMIVDVDANVLPIYASGRIHAEAAAEWILGA